jgi:hypothetical protein
MQRANRIPRIVFQWKFSARGHDRERRWFPAPGVMQSRLTSQGKTPRRAVVDVRNPPFAWVPYVALEPCVALR